MKVGDKVIVCCSGEGFHGDYYEGDIGVITDSPHQYGEEIGEKDIMVNFGGDRTAYRVLNYEIRKITKLDKVLL